MLYRGLVVAFLLLICSYSTNAAAEENATVVASNVTLLAGSDDIGASLAR